MQTCIVCTLASPRYRCPACYERYCSIKCFATHKKECTGKPPPPPSPPHKSKQPVIKPDEQQIIYHPADPVTAITIPLHPANDAKLSEQQLDKCRDIETSSELQKILKQLVKMNDDPERRMKELDEIYQENEEFRKFWEQVLVKIESS